ncbi:protein involved in polysaccharide export with SLBB domain [Humitalea rosea]|uniref:Protein involved in polysaccharide export with SLBB domain n=2 Tax=Humitalea rosea TaxID=990373 RepID=A0A2W7IIE5_9PROT|nr:protein involved in polysaccharide export with SLBB domain [Humitalea rosea]
MAAVAQPAPAPLPSGAGYLSAPQLPAMLPGGVTLPNLSPQSQQEILQRILDAAGGRAVSPPPPPSLAAPVALPLPVVPVAQPLAPPPPPTEPLSGSEAYFAARLDGGLRQFGYDIFRGMLPQGPASGALPDDYILGRDDEVQVAIRGRTRAAHSLRVTRDGTLLLPDLAPFPAAGRTLRDLRAEIEARVQRELGGSEAFVSIGQLRQMGVLTAGEVVRPGVQPLPALATVLDALGAANGVRKTGSLRAIRVEGPRGPRLIDLYPLLVGEGGSPDLSLREGDRVIVPALGGVIAIGGEVTRPGIFELPAGARSVPLAEALRLAGEPLRPAGNRFLLQGTDSGGRRAFSEIGLGTLVRRGDAVLVQPMADVPAGAMRLAGHVAVPVTRAAGRGASLQALLADSRLVRADPYVRLGVVWRVDAGTRARRFIPFDLGRVLQRHADLPLREEDEIIILAQPDVLWLASPPVQHALRGEAPVAASATTCPALMALAIAARSSPQRFAHARGAGFPDIGEPPCPRIFLEYPTLLPFLLDTAVLLTGEVRLPGLYPVLDDTGLDMVIAAGGGVTDTADLAAIEHAREPLEQAGAIPLQRTLLDLRSRNFAAIRLSPRDAVRVPRGFGDRDIGPVTLLGEVVRPGVYDIRRGERLSELLLRAGGLTPQAYAYGTVFTRESVRVRQQDGFARTAQQLEQSLIQVAAGQAVAGSRAGGVDLGSAITAGRELASALREARAAGRMVVEANPVVLAARPDLDVLLEPGDLIALPKRPNEVTVVGAVLNAGSLQFTTGWRASDYVQGAGGPQRFADNSRAFVVLPNGQSVPAGLGSWQQGGPPVPPGSLVVVPQDPSPYETWGFIRDLTQVFSQVGISAAALAVVAREAAK